MISELETLSRQLLSALANGAYQGLLLTFLVWMGVKCAPRTNASTRYAIWLVTLFMVAALPILHFAIHDDRSSGPGQVEVKWEPKTSSPEALPELNPEPPDWHVPQFQAELDRTDALAPQIGESVSPPASVAVAENPHVLNIRPSGLFAESDEVAVASLAKPSIGLVPWRWEPSISGRAALVANALWIALAGCGWLVLLGRYFRLLRLKRRSQPAPEPFRVLFDSVRAEHRISRRIELRVDSELRSPVAAGFFRPAVLLPAALITDRKPHELEPVLRHELAHLRRRDDWTNLLQEMIRAALFFHPSVRWLAGRMTIDREIACDDHVLAATGKPRDYALCLTDLATRTQGRFLMAAPAAWNKTSQLNERIDMILNTKRNTSTRLARARTGALTLLALFTAVAGLYGGPRLALAQQNIESTEEHGARPSDSGLNKESTPAVAAELPPGGSPPFGLPPMALPPGQALPGQDPDDLFPGSISSVEDAIPPQPGAPARRSARKASSVAGQIAHPVPKPAPFPAPAIVDAPLPMPAIPKGDPFVNPVPPVAPQYAYPAPKAPVMAVAPKPSGPALFNLAQPKGRAHSGDDSLEHRLERLERLVESLVRREQRLEKPYHPGQPEPQPKQAPQIHLKDGSAKDQGKEARRTSEIRLPLDDLHIDFELEHQLELEGLNEALFEIREQAVQAADRASREAERATRVAERAAAQAARAAQRAINKDEQEHFKHHHGVSHRHMLEEQREALQEQLRRIERELAQLEGSRSKPEHKKPAEPEPKAKEKTQSEQ